MVHTRMVLVDDGSDRWRGSPLYRSFDHRSPFVTGSSAMTYLWYLFYARVLVFGVILTWYYGRKEEDDVGGAT